MKLYTIVFYLWKLYKTELKSECVEALATEESIE